MPAVSQKQAKFFKIVKGVKTGETPKKDVTKNVRQVVDKMSEKEIDKMTKVKKESCKKKVNESLFMKIVLKENNLA